VSKNLFTFKEILQKSFVYCILQKFFVYCITDRLTDGQMDRRKSNLNSEAFTIEHSLKIDKLA